MPANRLLINRILSYNFGRTDYDLFPSNINFGLSTNIMTPITGLSYGITGVSYVGKQVTIGINNNPYVIGDVVTVTNVDSQFGTTNIDGVWVVTSSIGTSSGSISFTVNYQPTGTTPQSNSGTSALVNGDALVEVSGSGYAQSTGYVLDNSGYWTTSYNGFASNANPIAFPQCTGLWGTIKAVFMNDTGTNIIWCWNLNPWITPAINDVITFGANSLITNMV